MRAIAFWLGTLLAPILVTTAQTADLGAAPAFADFDWSGLYVGGHAAYSLGRENSTLSDPNPTASSSAFSSLYGGLQAGYNYVFPS
jgi:high affinity Mn2+ porin